MSIEAEIEKQQDIIRCAAKALIGFGIWSGIGSIMNVLWGANFLANNDLGIPDVSLTKEYFIIFISIFTAIDLAIRALFARRAFKVAEGKKKPGLMYCFMIVYMIFDVLSYLTSTETATGFSGISEYVIFSAIEITSTLAMLEIIVAGHRLNKLNIRYKESKDIKEQK